MIFGFTTKFKTKDNTEQKVQVTKTLNFKLTTTKIEDISVVFWLRLAENTTENIENVWTREDDVHFISGLVASAASLLFSSNIYCFLQFLILTLKFPY